MGEWIIASTQFFNLGSGFVVCGHLQATVPVLIGGSFGLDIREERSSLIPSGNPSSIIFPSSLSKCLPHFHMLHSSMFTSSHTCFFVSFFPLSLFCFLSLLLPSFCFRSWVPYKYHIQNCEATCGWSITPARDIVTPSVCHLSLHLILWQPDLQHVILIKGELGVKWVDFSSGTHPVIYTGRVLYESAFLNAQNEEMSSNRRFIYSSTSVEGYEHNPSWLGLWSGNTLRPFLHLRNSDANLQHV